MKRKNKTRKAAPIRAGITATQFDSKFDAGEEIIPYLDITAARVFAPGEERLDAKTSQARTKQSRPPSRIRPAP